MSFLSSHVSPALPPAGLLNEKQEIIIGNIYKKIVRWEINSKVNLKLTLSYQKRFTYTFNRITCTYLNLNQYMMMGNDIIIIILLLMTYGNKL